MYPRKLGKSKALKKYQAWREKSKSNTYDVMKDYLDKYLKYIEINNLSPQFIIAGYKWFADRFDDELDLSHPQNSENQKRYAQKRVRKVMDWNEHFAQNAKTDSESKLSSEEVNQIFKQYSSAGKSNTDSDTDSNSLSQNADTDYELSDSMKQLYHDLGID